MTPLEFFLRVYTLLIVKKVQNVKAMRDGIVKAAENVTNEMTANTW